MTVPFVLTFGLPIVAALVVVWLGHDRANLALARSFAIALIPGVLVCGTVMYFADGSKIPTFYAASLRGSLFSGFLSLGGFLFSLKTFIVVKMKEGVYDKDWYEARVDEERIAHPKKEITRFGALGRLRSLLFWSIVTSLMTAVLQVTLGLAPSDVPVAIALGMAAVSLAFLAQSLMRLNTNLRMWFDHIEKDDKKRYQTKTKAEAAAAPA